MVLGSFIAANSANLYPFTATRPVEDIRVGILTIKEKWARLLSKVKTTHDSIIINSCILPTKKLVKQIALLKNAEQLVMPDGSFIAQLGTAANDLHHQTKKAILFDDEIHMITHPWNIFQLNDWAIRQDFDILTTGRKSQRLSKTNKCEQPQQIFVEKGAVVEHTILNASTGPIYIGKNAVIMEGCLIRGPLSLNEGAVLKMGTKIYGATTIGPFCVAGGEIKNSVLFGYSNKAHDGYLGDAVIGEWCNLGAGTSNSNMKNNASAIKIYNDGADGNPTVAGNKCGLLMGDYSTSAINTSFNTGTVVGICANVFYTGLTPKFIPDFSWGIDKRYDLCKALSNIANWKQLKNKPFTEEEQMILKETYQQKQH